MKWVWLSLALSLHMSVCPSPFLPCMEQHEVLTRSWADIARCMLLYFQNCKSKQISFFFKLFSLSNSVIAKENRLVLKQGTGTVLGKLCWVGHCTHRWQLEREGKWVLDSQLFCLWTSVASHQEPLWGKHYEGDKQGPCPHWVSSLHSTGQSDGKHIN
jgi:hypothetical protein